MAREQILRFVRLFAFAFLAQLGAIGTEHLDRTALIGAAIAAIEVSFRQLWPASTNGGREPDNSSEAVQ